MDKPNEVLSTAQRLKMRRFVRELASHKGRGTEFVSVYIPKGYELSKITTHLQQEQGTAVNIKSSSTRKNVIDALERMIQHLKTYAQTPSNGLAAFAGNVAEREGQSDVQVWSIEPPVPLNVRIYRCDKDFVLEHLEDMLDHENTYGLVVLDRRDATLALLKGKKIVPIKKTHSEVPGKFRAGGQSAPRFARIREGAIKDHFKKVADLMKDEFLHMKDLKGILLGGPGVTVNDFLNKDYITGDLKKKIIGTCDLSYADEFGLEELLEKSQEMLGQEEVAEEKMLVQKFLQLLSTEENKVAYGYDDIVKLLEMGAVETVLLSESIDDDKQDVIENLAIAQGTRVVIVSVDTREGEQLRQIGKIAAILRYAIDI